MKTYKQYCFTYIMGVRMCKYNLIDVHIKNLIQGKICLYTSKFSTFSYNMGGVRLFYIFGDNSELIDILEFTM